MKQRTATEQKHLEDIANKIRALGGHLPLVVSVTEGTKIRSSAQNAMYWTEIEHFLDQIREAIWRLSEFSGYSEAETRWVIAGYLPVEYRGIMYCLTKDSVHDTLKKICEIPTSTRLGTKSFKKFEERMAQTMTEIIGGLNAVVQKVAA